MRLTERRETPARRATSALQCPAFNRISTSCLFSIPNILLPPPDRPTDRGHRESSSSSGYRRACQNFRNQECQIFRNRQLRRLSQSSIYEEQESNTWRVRANESL